MAEPGSVLLTENTQRIVKNYFKLKSLGKLPIKGKAEPQEVYRIEDVSEVVTRLDASVARGLTQFIGRRDEMDTLLNSFKNTELGSGRIVGIECFHESQLLDPSAGGTH